MSRREAPLVERTDSSRKSDIRELGPARAKGSPSASARGSNVLPLGFSGDDAALVAAIKDGHAGAKAALFQRNAVFVERVITRVLGFDRELSDILQDVFLNALGSIHTLKNASLLRPWLFRVATLTARKVLRRRTRHKWLRLFVDSDEESRWELEHAATDASGENLRALRAVYTLLERLPVDERIAFALRYVEGMELTEVADASDVSLATIKRRLRRAERRFVKEAGKYPELGRWLEGGSRWNP